MLRITGVSRDREILTLHEVDCRELLLHLPGGHPIALGHFVLYQTTFNQSPHLQCSFVRRPAPNRSQVDLVQQILNDMLGGSDRNQPCRHPSETRVGRKFFLRCTQGDNPTISFSDSSIGTNINRFLNAVRQDNRATQCLGLFLAGQQQDDTGFVASLYLRAVAALRSRRADSVGSSLTLTRIDFDQRQFELVLLNIANCTWPFHLLSIRCRTTPEVASGTR